MRNPFVLIVTHGIDDHVPLVRPELEKLGVPLVCFDTGGYEAADLEFYVDGRAPRIALRINGIAYSGDAIQAVLFRHVLLPQAPHIIDPEARRMAASEMRWTLEGTLMALEPALWMNHPDANRLARNKLLQLRMAARLGFDVPDTLVTADPRQIRERYRAWNGRMIAKLVGGQIVGDTIKNQYVVHTTALSPEDLANDDALAACPAIYQRRVEKKYEQRVTVIGDSLFACRIDSRTLDDTQVDWRTFGYTELDIQPCELEPAVAERCRALARMLRLEVAGIDLIVTPDGETVFLEINAAGQWAWVEETTGLPIAAAVAHRMAAATRMDRPAAKQPA